MGTLTKMFSSQTETMRVQTEELTGEEVLAAGQLRQGSKPSMTAMLTGTALFGMMKPRSGKALPRHFVLALTPSRVVAFACVGVSDDDDGENYHVVVRGKERGSWARDAVSFAGTAAAGTLTVAGETFPVHFPNPNGEDEETPALLAALER
jgi:hypothetical protein